MLQEEFPQLKIKKSNRKRVENWLIRNQNFINITAIEKEVSAPKGLLQKFIKYDKKINDKWINPLYTVIKTFTSFTIR